MMPTEGTERQGFRYPRAKWKRFSATAKKNGTNASELLQQFADWYVGEPKSRPIRKPEQLTAEEASTLDDE